MRALRLLALPALLVVSHSCSCEAPTFPLCVDEQALPEVSREVTWHQDVAPIVHGRCTRCHEEGGLAPFPLSTYDEVRAAKDAVRDAVVSRRMPPWLPARCCGAYANDTSLSDEQIATIAAWVDAGAREGDASSPAPALPARAGLPRVDVALEMPEAYTPAPAFGTDETRCFLLDWPLAEEKFVTGFGLVPGQRALVHHAVALIVSAEQAKGYAEDDVNDPLPGFACPGGGLARGFTGYVGGWSPGWEAQTTPEGFGHRMPPDARIVLSMHYSLPHDGGEAGADRTRVELMLEDEVEGTLEAVAVFQGFWPLGAMPIPKGDDDVLHSVEYEPVDVVAPGRTLSILAVNLHMHERGASAVLGIKRADGSEDCLVQIDDWDHGWQGDYVLEEPKPLGPDDRVTLACRFDNTEGNQRPGEEPRDLNWAEDGEMCVAYLTVAKPL